MQKEKKSRYNLWITVLATMVCVFMIAGIALGVGSVEGEGEGETGGISPFAAGIWEWSMQNGNPQNDVDYTKATNFRFNGSTLTGLTAATIAGYVTIDGGVYSSEAIDAAWIDPKNNNFQVNIPADILQASTTYTITVSEAFQDASGDTCASGNPFVFTFTTADTAGGVPVGNWAWSTSPAGPQSGVDYKGAYVILFEHADNTNMSALEKAYVSGFFSIDGGAFTKQAITVDWMPVAFGGRRVTLTIPAGALAPSTEYTITISGDFVAGNGTTCQSGEDFHFVFTTMDPPVSGPTDPIFLNPAEDGYVGISADATLEIAFAAEVDAGTVDLGVITLKEDVSGADVAFALTWSEEFDYVLVKPDAPLVNGASYILGIDAGYTISGFVVNPASVHFTTASFNIEDVSTSAYSRSSETYEVSFLVRNIAETAKDLYGSIVVRGGKGARDTEGGYVFALIDFNRASVIKGETIAVSDVVDIKDEVLDGIYIDIYVWHDASQNYIDADTVHQTIGVVD